SGDHQVEDEEEIAFESDDDALAHSTHVAHAPAFGGFGRRLEGPQQVEPQDADLLDLLAHDSAREVLDVERDVRQLGHGEQRSGSIDERAGDEKPWWTRGCDRARARS